MKVVGLVTEYNPFHKGHLYHIEKSKQITGADYCICVMSGNFVQRGNPAIIDKWNRTKSALLSGMDMVIELPIHYSVSSAEYFASAAVSLLNDTGVVDSICFGSELGTLEPLDNLAEIFVTEPRDYKKLLQTHLKSGHNFPSARSLALNDLEGSSYSDIINNPNNILGIEYLKALKRLKSNIKAYTIQRIGAGYHDSSSESNIASATAIRNQILKAPSPSKADISNMLPPESYLVLKEAIAKNQAPIFPSDIFSLLRYKLITTPEKQLANILDISEGLENRIIASIKSAQSYDELIEMLMTRRYPKTKLHRALIHILLDIDKKSFEIFSNNGYSQYIRVLGFRKDAQPLMRKMKYNSSLPVLGKIKGSEKALTSLQQKMLSDEIRATEIYNTIIMNKYNIKSKNDYSIPLIMI